MARALARPLALLLFALLITSSRPAGAEWEPIGKLSIPRYDYTFLAATPQGDLLAATFHSVPATAPPKELPALLIQNPGSSSPNVVELCRSQFEPQRGYGGIAADPTGAFFVSGDTGNAATCFVRKFQPNGSPAIAFGQGGEIRPNRRTLGVTVFDRYLYLAVDWGEIRIYSSENGQFVGVLPKPPGEVYVRDIAIDPKSMRVFGVAHGAVVTWGKGTPWNPTAYQYRAISQEYGSLRAGEGISIDPFRRTILFTPIPGNFLYEIEGSLKITKTTVASADLKTHLADTVISFDGTTVYISDMLGHCIHAMRRAVPQVISQAAPTAPIATPADTTGNVIWSSSYAAVVQTAREQRKPMLIYFGNPNVKKAQDFEKQILQSGEFNAFAAGRFVCVSQDVTKDRLTAYQFGAYRVPHVIILDGSGETAAEFSNDIDKGALLAAMAKLR